MSININFSEQDWERIERDWTRWWAGDLPRPMVIIENAELGRKPEEVTREFLLETDPEAILDHHQTQLEQTRYFGDAWPKWWPFYGAGVVAAFLGANMGFAPETKTIWFEPPQPLDLQTADLTFDPNNIYWQRIQALTRLAAERWGDKICLGFTDLGGNLDILASLRTSQHLLFDLLDQPEAVARLARQITRVWLRCYNEQHELIKQTGRGSTPWASIWSPGRCYMFQSDLAYMISPKMFEQFVLPDLTACCEQVDHAFYHLDGKGQIAHLDMLLSMEKMHGIQWIPGDGQAPPEGWLPLLRRIRNAGKLCQLYVSPEGARTIAKELGGRGFALHILQPMEEAEATAFLKQLAEDDKGD